MKTPPKPTANSVVLAEDDVVSHLEKCTVCRWIPSRFGSEENGSTCATAGL